MAEKKCTYVIQWCRIVFRKIHKQRKLFGSKNMEYKMTEANNYMVHNFHIGIRKQDRIELCYFTNDGIFDKYFMWRECDFRTYVTPLYVCAPIYLTGNPKTFYGYHMKVW